ncbi:hypothetical protein CBS147320_10990 [Aspergillus niger]|nr:hypothetical protein CBS12448_10986 [Aspergillus niger]KAI2912120.1 hypothetical protein CBS147320_10990 [Aspergillus niger]KAI2995273.1 hypothetical protein CBS147346_10002 [Aspergillus niger]
MHTSYKEAAYYSHDTIKEMDGSSFHLPTGAEAEPGVPPHNLSLEVGCVASIMRNLSIEKGLVKNVGCRWTTYLPMSSRRCRSSASLASPSNSDRTVPIGPSSVASSQCRWHATTFNSCQGLTPVFAHGQLYTSLSRVRRGADIYPTLNVVYRDLLLPI